MKVYRCWWCSGEIEGQGRDCGRKPCIDQRRSGAWRTRKNKRKDRA